MVAPAFLHVVEAASGDAGDELKGKIIHTERTFPEHRLQSFLLQDSVEDLLSLLLGVLSSMGWNMLDKEASACFYPSKNIANRQDMPILDSISHP